MKNNNKIIDFTTKKPIVSVAMLCYNHEKYLVEAIESVLMQKTDFTFQMVIAEDFSTDNTRNILLDYQGRFPEKIKLILQDENVGSAKNSNDLLTNIEGKYIALLECDDYWIDSLKLQKQVDFLEANSDYGLVHGDCNMKYENKNKVVLSLNQKNGFNHDYKDDENLLFDRILSGSYKIRTATSLFRASLYFQIQDQLKIYQSKFLMGDIPLWILLSSISKFGYIDEVLSVYRLSPSSATRSKNKAKVFRFRLSSYEFRVFIYKEKNKILPQSIKNKYNESLINYRLYNRNYAPMFPMIEPNKVQIVLYKYSKFLLLRNVFKLRTKPNYFKIIYNKLFVK
jgi:glycosyltransferase involved in cell wall biosynthesis